MADLIAAFCSMLIASWGSPDQHDSLSGATRFPSGVSDRPAWVEYGPSCSVIICSLDPVIELAIIVPQQGDVCPIGPNGSLAAGRDPEDYDEPRPATLKIGPQAALNSLETILSDATPSMRLARLGHPEIVAGSPVSRTAEALVGDSRIATYGEPTGTGPFAVIEVTDVLDLPEVIAPLSRIGGPVSGSYFGPGGAIIVSSGVAYAFQGPTAPTEMPLSIAPASASEALSLAACLYAQAGNRVGWTASLSLSRLFPSIPPRNPRTCEIVP